MVADKYYKLYRWVLLVQSVGIIAAWVIFNFTPSLKASASNDGLTIPILAMNLASVIYLLGFYNLASKKFNHWQSTLLGIMIFGMSLLAAIRLTTTAHNSVALLCFIGIWLFQMAWAGVFGPQVIILDSFFCIAFVYFGGFANKYLLVMVGGTLFLSPLFQLLVWRNLQGKVFDGLHTNKKVDPFTNGAGDSRSTAESLINSINEGVVVIDKTGRITVFNPAAEVITGWSAEDAKNIDVNLVVTIIQENGKAFPLQSNPFNSILTTRTKVDMTVQLISKMGKQFFISLVAAPIILNGEITGVAFTMRDITIQRNIEQQKLDFISTASHEMRTPVAAIEGYLELAMNDKISSIDAKAREYLGKARASTEQLSRLFQDLLNSSKAEDGRLVNHPEVLEMGSYISRLAEGFQLAAEKKHLIVNFALISNKTDQGAPRGKIITPLYYTYVDPERLMEVLTNLYDNAIKYTQAGSITIGLGGDDTNVTIFVRDTGAGIPAESIDHLFQKFYRVDNSAVRTIGGTGLGLYICKKIVELYNGKIWAESTLGKGSTFYINLPRLSQQQTELLRTSATRETAPVTAPIGPTV
jgi:PAS domain S-box-containing protein